MSYSVGPYRRQPTRLPRPWDSPGKNTGAGCHFILQCMKVKSESEVALSCPTLGNPMDCSLPGSSVHGIFQARVLEWGAIAFSENSLASENMKELYLELSIRSFVKNSHTQKCPEKKTQPLKIWHLQGTNTQIGRPFLLLSIHLRGTKILGRGRVLELEHSNQFMKPLSPLEIFKFRLGFSCWWWKVYNFHVFGTLKLHRTTLFIS